jgi:pectate lyase
MLSRIALPTAPFHGSWLVAIFLGWAATATEAERDLPAFPGAEGFGASTPGGRGGKVLLVTTLDDYLPGKEKPIPGSLRWACQTVGPRIVVFRTGGTIQLKTRLRITEPMLTIAGQTAPGGGICLKDHDVQVKDAHDVVIRHLRIRPGDVTKSQLDALSVYRSQRVVFDHCSVSWATDETLSVTGENCTDVTVQGCLISESLNDSAHPKGPHGYGSLIVTNGNVTFHHNIYAHHSNRCPRGFPQQSDSRRQRLFLNRRRADELCGKHHPRAPRPGVSRWRPRHSGVRPGQFAARQAQSG